MTTNFPRTTLGRTGLQVSRVGLGGITLTDTEPQHACDMVAHAIERGINYFDIAPTYGNAEIRLGPALKPFRDQAVLACKTTRRDRAGAHQELHNSLKRLQTDHLDLYQLHAVNDIEKDVKAAFAPDGAMTALTEAHRQGLIRNLGFSAHSPAAALAALDRYDFDTVMLPVNFILNFTSDFETKVLAQAQKRNLGIIAIKAIAHQKWSCPKEQRPYQKPWYQPFDDETIARLALSWTYSRDIHVVLPPCEEPLFELCVKLTPQCRPLTPEQLKHLQEIAGQTDPIFP